MRDKIVSLCLEKNYKALRELTQKMNAVDLALLLCELDGGTQMVIFRLLQKDLAARVFIEMDEDVQRRLISQFSDSELRGIIDELYIDDAVDMIEEMPANVVKRIIAQARPDMRKMINEVLRYPEDSAGSIMNTEFVTLKASMSVKSALEHIRRTGRDMETVNTLYVVTSKQRLIGIVTIGELIFSEPACRIADIMNGYDIISVGTHDDRESAALLSEKYSLDVLPVVDREGRLVGIVTSPDLSTVMQQEATEDIEVMAAITPDDTPYIKQSVISIFKSRVPWLMILMLSATFTGMIISHFENALSAVPVISAFIPMLMGTGGNAGAQASATVIRGLSLDEIRLRDVFRVILKEIRVAMLCGLALSVLMFIKLLTVDRLIIGREVTALVAAAVCVTLFFTVIFAKITGGFLPLAAKRLGVDPAVMASPFITTLTDTVTLVLYFVISSRILGI